RHCLMYDYSFLFSSRRRHTISYGDWSSDVCSSDLIFGYTPSQTEPVRRYAIDLGIALQLTNILRDVAEDAQRGRIYLPAEDLREIGRASCRERVEVPVVAGS